MNFLPQNSERCLNVEPKKNLNYTQRIYFNKLENSTEIEKHFFVRTIRTCCSKNYLSLIFREINDFVLRPYVDFTILVVNFTILNC
jgi:hypothetical protein